MPKNNLDKIDAQILMELQANGRLNNQDLADRVSLSPSPCLRRVRRLEEEGYIRRYVALVDPDNVGRGLLAYVSIRLNKSLRATHAPMSDLARDVQGWPDVVECYVNSGVMDNKLTVRVVDFKGFYRF